MSYAVMPYDDYKAACDAVREKTGKTDKIKSGDLAAEVKAIQTGTEIKNQDKTITENGEYAADSSYTGLGTVTVNVPEKEPVLQDKEVTTNGSYTADEGFDGLREVLVNVPSKEPVVEPLTVTENGEYTPPNGVDGYAPVTVNVAASGGETSDIEAQWIAAIERGDTQVTKLPDGITSIGNYAFYNGTNLALTSLPDGVTSIGNAAFYNCTGLTEITFKSKPKTITSSAFLSCTNLLTINVPWAEGEVANAPWGATNATINYNYVEE